MNDQANKPSHLASKIAIVVVVLIIVILGQSKIKQIVQSFRVRTGRAAPEFTTTAWTKRTLGDISLEAPFEFGPGPDVMSKLSAEVRAAIEKHEIFEGRDPSGTFRVAISRIAYNPGIQVSLDGAVNGAMTNAATAAGDHDPKFSAANTPISGLDGRRATYSGNTSGRTLHIEGLFAQRGQKIWAIQVIYFSDTGAADAKRLLDGVQIAQSN